MLAKGWQQRLSRFKLYSCPTPNETLQAKDRWFIPPAECDLIGRHQEMTARVPLMHCDLARLNIRVVCAIEGSPCARLFK